MENPNIQYHPILSDVYFVDASSHASLNASLKVSLDTSKMPLPLLHIDDGYNYGLSFFETIYVHSSAVFLHEHIQRLNRSLADFHIPIIINEQLILDIIATYQVHHCALKVHVSATNIVASTRPLVYTQDYYTNGTKLITSPIRRSSQSQLIRHKSANYGECILALRKAHELGFNDSLFYNELGHVTETCIANIFFIKDHVLYTPSLSDGLLPGIVREYILNKYTVLEQSLSKAFILTCEGAFLTNSLVGVVKIASIDDNKLSDHPLIETIRQNYLADIKET